MVLHSSLHYLYVHDLPGWHDDGFVFFNVNLLVWRFEDSISSYRFFSFLVTLLILTSSSFLLTDDLSTHLMSMAITLIFFGNVLFSKTVYVRREDGRGLAEQNRTINIRQLKNERTNGRDLHDTLGHTFAMMSLKTELALKQMDKEQYEAARKNLEELNQISRDSMYEVREIVNKLKYRTVAEELLELERLFDLSDIVLTVDSSLDFRQPVTPLASRPCPWCFVNWPIMSSNIARLIAVRFRLRRDHGISPWSLRMMAVALEEVIGQELHSIGERLSLADGDLKFCLNRIQPSFVHLKEGGKA